MHVFQIVHGHSSLDVFPGCGGSRGAHPAMAPIEFDPFNEKIAVENRIILVWPHCAKLEHYMVPP